MIGMLQELFGPAPPRPADVIRSQVLGNLDNA